MTPTAPMLMTETSNVGNPSGVVVVLVVVVVVLAVLVVVVVVISTSENTASDISSAVADSLHLTTTLTRYSEPLARPDVFHS